jgi:putative ABC transport system permease protein
LLSIPSAVVSPEYFDTLGIPVVRGRGFDGHDSVDTAQVVVVNEAMAAKYWSGGDALDRPMTILEDSGARRVRVIGIVRTVIYNSFEEKPEPVLYVPIEQGEVGGLALFARTDGDPVALIPAIRREVLAVNRDAPIVDVRTLFAQVRQRALMSDRLIAEVVTAVAAAGLALAIFGLYAVLAYAVSQRTHEIGIRLAVGATAGRVVRMVLGQGLMPAAAGILIGIPLVLALRSVAAATLAPADPLDSLLYVGAALIAVAFIACLVPARRAARVDPTIALRCE